jgi:hypothetical protein
MGLLKSDKDAYKEDNPGYLATLAPLSVQALEVLAIVEQLWWTKNVTVTPQNIAKYVDIDADIVKNVWKEPAFLYAIKAKGINIVKVYKDILTPKQIATANIVLNHLDRRTLQQKLKITGTTTTQWNAWLSEAAFAEYVEKKSGGSFKSGDYLLRKNLLNGLEDGDLAATKLYAEIRGIINNKVQVDVNINVVLQQVIEVLQQFIPQERRLEAAEALERLGSFHGNTSNFDVVDLAISPIIGI